MKEKSKNSLLYKISSEEALKNIFGYLPKKRSISILLPNQYLLQKVHLEVDDYYLPKPYQKILKSSNGDINNLYNNILKYFLEDKTKYFKSFKELRINFIKYIDYLIKIKHYPNFFLDINLSKYLDYSYIFFMLEVIRKLKVDFNLNFKLINSSHRLYEIFQNALKYNSSINTLYVYNIPKSKSSFIPDYIDLFNWEKINSLKINCFSNCNIKFLENIPKNSKFKSLIIDNNESDTKNEINQNKLSKFIENHGEHIEIIEINNININDFYFKFENFEINSSFFFLNLSKLKYLKFKNCKNITLNWVLEALNNSLSSLKTLYIDNISIDNTNSDNSYNDLIFKSSFLSNFEELIILFNQNIELSSTKKQDELTIQLLINIIKSTKKLKYLELDMNLNNFYENKIKVKCKNKELENNSSGNQKNYFSQLVEIISELHNLETFNYLSPMNDSLTIIFNDKFKVGESLKSLSITHSSLLNTENLFNKHPFLDKINFLLYIDERNFLNLNNKKNKTEKKDKTKEKNIWNKDEICKFKYKIPKRSWKSIQLKNYPINDNLMERIVESRNCLEHLKLKNIVNMTKNSNVKINAIISQISK